MARWIPPEEEASALRALRDEYRLIDHQLFRGRLRPASLAYTDDRSLLGRWSGGHRTIELNRDFVCSAPWLETVEVLKHEMAHQAVEELFGVRDEEPHGPTFRRLCLELGIDHGASGRPTPDPAASSAMRRVEKLLSLGQSSERHEAEAAMKKAQALLRAYNLGRIRTGETSGYSFRQLGAPLSRIEGHHRGVVAILSRHFFVEVIWVPAFVPGRPRMGSVPEISGTPENLEVAAYVHDFLHHTATRLWAAHRSRSRVSGHARRKFLTGVMMGFAEKLAASEIEASGEDRALLRVGDPALRAYLRRRYPRQSTLRGSGTTRDANLDAGRAAGREIVLRKGVASSGAVSGRLLGPGRG